MKVLYFLAAFVAVATVYAIWLRPWLSNQPWAKPFYDKIAPIERALFKNSETILFARLKIFVGLALTVLTQLGTIDLTPVMPFIPEQHRGLATIAINLLPLAISLVGMLDERLRNCTTKPIELVALPENKPLPPQVAIAVAKADIARENAVETVKRKM